MIEKRLPSLFFYGKALNGGDGDGHACMHGAIGIGQARGMSM